MNTQPPSRDRPLGVTLSAIFFLVEGIGLNGAIVYGALQAAANPTMGDLLASAGLGMLIAFPFLAVAAGLLAQRKWALAASVVLCALVVLAIPGWNLGLLLALAPFNVFIPSYLLINKGARAAFEPPPPPED